MTSLVISQKIRPKPRVVPVNEDGNLGQSLDDSDARRTPFRLTWRDQKQEDEMVYKVWSRYGYEYYNNKPSDLTPVVSKMTTPPPPTDSRKMGAGFPRFRHAMIAPKSPGEPKLYAADFIDPAFYRPRYTSKQAFSEQIYPEYDPSPTPVAQSEFPGRMGKPFQWTLSSYNRRNNRKKGKPQAHGPFSREFTVTCMAPTNWLKMKWGRSKTSVV